MKKLVKWFKIMARKLFKKTVSNIDILENNFAEISKKKEKITEILYSYRGKVKYFEDTIEEINKQIKKLVKGAKICLEKDDDILLARCKTEIDTLKEKKTYLNKNLTLSKTLCEKAYVQKNLADSKLSELESKMDSLKMKSDFKKEVEDFSTIIDGDLGVDFADIEKDIEIDFNSSEMKLDDITADNFDVKDIIKSNDLEDFKKELRK